MQESAYYDGEQHTFIRKYLLGNERVEAAIKLLFRWLPEGSQNILDVGCGLGWTTHEIASLLPKAQVLGIDLSGRSIDAAKRLFPDPNIEFEAIDLVAIAQKIDRKMDAAVLIDVYEHIRPEHRPPFHAQLSRLLTEKGALILTVPTIAKQENLRKHHPEQMQPVDEDISQGVLEKLAADVNGSLIHYEEVSVWQPGDYAHAVIARNPSLVPRASRRKPESPESRGIRVEEAFGLRLQGKLLTAAKGPPIAIAVPNKGLAISETFIQSHIERLPATVHLLTRCGGRKRWCKKGPVSILRKSGIKAILAEYAPTAFSVLTTCSRLQIPLIVHFHGYDLTMQGVLEKHDHYKPLLKGAQSFVVVSEGQKELLLNLGAAESKIHVISCGIDTNLFRPLPSEPSPSFTFLAAGRFVEKKGPILTLSAFREVLRSYPEAKLQMVGTGPLLGYCKELVSRWGISGQVEFLGPQAHSTLPLIMNQASCFLQHSVIALNGDREGNPLSVMEAASTGLPVVATRHMGIKQSVVDGKTGYLVDEYDVCAMADRMKQLIASPEQAKTMGAMGREHVVKNYDQAKQIKELWTVIEKAIQTNEE